MSQSPIFLPMGVLAAWTFIVLLLIPFRRFQAGFAGTISADDFKFGESSKVPGHVSIPNRAMMNLLELPVLFYVVCLMFVVTARVDATIVEVAWAYVGLRLAQTLIHITYNNVMHRLTVFTLGNIVLIGMWFLFFFPVIGK